MAWPELILVCGFAGGALGVAVWRRWHARSHAGATRFKFRWQLVGTALLGPALLALGISRWAELRGLDPMSVAGLSFLLVALGGGLSAEAHAGRRAGGATDGISHPPSPAVVCREGLAPPAAAGRTGGAGRLHRPAGLPAH